MLKRAASYDALARGFRWEIPARYNLGVDICDKHGDDALALIHEREDGTAGDARRHSSSQGKTVDRRAQMLAHAGEESTNPRTIRPPGDVHTPGRVPIPFRGGPMTPSLLVALAGMLMVSNIKFYSFKDLDLKGRVPFVAILAVVLVFAVVFSDPPRILLLIFLAYAASGPVQYLLQLRRRKQVE